MRLLALFLMTACPPPTLDTDEDTDTDTVDADTDTDTDTVDTDTDTDTDSDSDTGPPPPDPIVVTIYAGGDLSVGSAVAFFDGDGALLEDTITDAAGQVMYTPSDSAPVDIAAAVGDDVVLWAWVPGGAEPVAGAPGTTRSNAYSVQFAELASSDQVTRHLVYTPSTQFSSNAYVTEYTPTNGAPLEDDGTFDLYAVARSDDGIVGTVRMQDLAPMPNEQLIAPEWTTLTMPVSLTVTASGSLGAQIDARISDLSATLATDALTSGQAAAYVMPSDADSLEAQVVSSTATGISETRIRFDANGAATLVQDDLLAPPTSVDWNSDTRTLSWAAEDRYDTLRASFVSGDQSFTLYLPGDATSPYLLPDLPISITGPERGGGAPIGTAQVYLFDGPASYEDRIHSNEDTPLNGGELERTSTNETNMRR